MEETSSIKDEIHNMTNRFKILLRKEDYFSFPYTGMVIFSTYDRSTGVPLRDMIVGVQVRNSFFR